VEGSVSQLTGTKLFFLVGSPRSGTTWLQALLSRSEFVASAPETHMFDEYMRSFFWSWNNFRRGSGNWGLHLLLEESEFLAMVRQAAGVVFSKILLNHRQATTVVEKSPSHGLFGKEILSVFPDAHFIHLVRDPRAVVSSLMAASRTWAKDWAPGNIQGATDLWVEHVNRARSISALTPNYYELKYRDLALDGPRSLKKLFDWMKIPATKEQCDRFVEECRIDRLRGGKLADPPWGVMPVDGREFFRVGSRTQWQSDLTRRQVALVEWIAGDLMDEFGFERSVPYGGRPWAFPIDRAKVDLRRALKWRLESWTKRL